MTLNTTRSKVPYICITDKISVRFSLGPAVFGLQDISTVTFWRNYDTMTLKPTRSNIPYICATSIHESQFSLRFPLRSAVFEIKATLRIVQRITRKLPWSLQGEKHSVCITSISESQFSLRFVLWPASYELLSILRQLHQMPPNYLEHYTRSKVHHICVTSINESQISVLSVLRLAIFKISHIL